MAATSITIEATTGDGRPLDALGALIQKRTLFLHETTRDATVATMITALKSLRAATRKNRGGIKTVTVTPGDTLSVSVSELPGFYLGFMKGGKAVVRDSTGAKYPEIKPWIKKEPRRYKAPIFKIVLSDDRVVAWPRQRKVSYIAAANLGEATRIITERFSKVAAKSSSLAKDALSLAMQKVSTKPATLTSGRQNVLTNANLVIVNKNENGFAKGSIEILVEDNLRYAADALNGGQSTVATALARAANSINGYLNRYIEQHHLLADGELPTPFPDDMFNPDTGMLIGE